jgi:hypothetical protein
VEASSRRQEATSLSGGRRGDKGFREISYLVFIFTILLHVLMFVYNIVFEILKLIC